MTERTGRQRCHSYYEATARGRIDHVLDSGSFREILDPTERLTSPHLAALDLPVAFDDGIVVGRGLLEGKKVLVASQEGGFMGGAVGEVHGAKLTGLLELALRESPAGVLLLLESGGVRLHEANAGLIAISEIIRALLAVRKAGIRVVGLIGGQFGCFGGMGIVARCCERLIISEEGRLGLSGPDVIETTIGVEEFDASDRALVWRTYGGKHRFLLGEVQQLVEDDVAAFRQAAIGSLEEPGRDLSLASLEQEHELLARRLVNYARCKDAVDIWAALGLDDPRQLPVLEVPAFLRAVGQAGMGDA